MVYYNYNGKYYKEGSAIISPDSRGLKYGDGLFETMKMLDGKVNYEDEHFARLWKGLKILQFDIPKHFSAEQLQAEILALAKKNKHVAAARVRLSIYRGEGGLYDPKNQFPSYIIQTYPLPTTHEELNTNGLVLGLYKQALKSCDILSNLKHNNYLPNVLAALQAKKEKWNDAIILNAKGLVCETSIANIFIIKDNHVLTPALDEGCVAGILRKTVINCLLRDNNEVIEKPISLPELYNADEVFLTNSISNIRWVQRIEDFSFTNTVTRNIFHLLQTFS